MAGKTGNEDLLGALKEEILFCRSALHDLVRLIREGDRNVSGLPGTVTRSVLPTLDDIHSFRLNEILRIREIADKFPEQGIDPGKRLKNL
jgi:hypothetical protein